MDLLVFWYTYDIYKTIKYDKCLSAIFYWIGLLKKEITQCCHEYYKRNTSDAELDDTADLGADVDPDAIVDTEILALRKRSYPVDHFPAGAIIICHVGP